jgi:hypothetical protein
MKHAACCYLSCVAQLVLVAAEVVRAAPQDRTSLCRFLFLSVLPVCTASEGKYPEDYYAKYGYGAPK